LALKNRWKTQFQTVPSRSKFHESVQEIFCTDRFFKGFRCYQEVSVADIVEDFGDRRMKYDWYIEDLGVVLELHGAQHYKCVTFGKVSYETAQQQFANIKHRDALKKQAAISAGYTYVEVPYKLAKKLTPELLKTLILGGDND